MNMESIKTNKIKIAPSFECDQLNCFAETNSLHPTGMQGWPQQHSYPTGDTWAGGALTTFYLKHHEASIVPAATDQPGLLLAPAHPLQIPSPPIRFLWDDSRSSYLLDTGAIISIIDKMLTLRRDGHKFSNKTITQLAKEMLDYHKWEHIFLNSHW